MSEKDEVFAKAVELGKVISKTELHQKIKEAEKAIREDEEALKIVKDFQALQNAYRRAEMLGNKPTEKQIKKLEEAEQEAIRNPKVKAYYDAHVKFHEFVQEVNAKIQEGIKEGD
ncbi:MAG: YlbF family regulator [Peptococcaceae bacterium]|nr:YlbF family regulator [Peptococcaceae bacterium]